MTTFYDIWRKLAKSKKYREQFALSLLKRSVPLQISALRKRRCGSQAVLAERANLTQGVVSRAEDQEYGNLTFNTVGRIAAGLDMAFIGKFVPFSELVTYSLELSEDEFANIPVFEEENSLLHQVDAATVQTLPEVSARRSNQQLALDEALAAKDEQGEKMAAQVMPYAAVSQAENLAENLYGTSHSPAS